MEVLARVSKFMLALVLALVAVLGALVLLLVLALKFVDWNEHKDRVIGVIERYSDWEVEQLGHLEVDLFFPTKIRVDNVELNQLAATSPLTSISADHFEISLDPLSPLLNDRPVIHHIEVSGARIVAQAPEEPPEQLPEDSGPLAIPHIETARIRDTDIVLQGDVPQQDRNLHIAALDVDSQGEDEGLTVAGNGNVEGLDMALTGTMGALSNLSENRPLPFDFEGTVAEDQFAVQGEVAAGEEASSHATVSVEGESLPRIAETFGISLGEVPRYDLNFTVSGSAEQIIVEDIQARLGETSLSGDASLQLDEPKPYLRANLSSSLVRQQDLASLIPVDTAEPDAPEPQPASSDELPQLDVLDALNAEVSYTVDEFEGDLLWPVTGAGLNATLVDGQLDASGQVAIENQAAIEDQVVTLDATLGPHQDGPDATTLPFDLAVSMAGDTLASEGQVIAGDQGLAYQAETRTEGDNLSQLAGLLSLDLAQVPAYELSFAVDGSTDRVSIEDIQGTLGESTLRGEASVQLDQPKPYLRANLASSLLREQDLASLVPQGPAQPVTRESTQAPSGEPPQLDFLDTINAEVSYRVAEYEGELLGPIAGGGFGARLEDGQLEFAGEVDAEELEITLEGAVGPQQEGAGTAALPFAIEAAAAGDTLTSEGRITAGNDGIGLMAETSAEGANIASIAQIFGVELEDVPSYQINFAISGTPQQVNVEDIEATLGSSYLYGDVSLQLDQAKPYLRANLGSSLLREQDLASLIPTGLAQPDIPEAPSLDFLDALNAELSFTVAELEGELLGQVSGADLDATLEQGELDFAGQVGVEDLEVSLDGTLGPQQGGPNAAVLPFELEATAAGDTLATQGQIAVEGETLSFSADTVAAGNNLAQIAGLFDIALTDAPAYDVSFTAAKSADEVSIADLQLTLGRSYLYGDASLQLGDPRPYLSADLGISLLRQQDLMGIIPAGEDAPDEAGEETEEEAADDNVFSREPLNLDALQQLDADIRLAVGQYVGATGAPLISGMTVQSRLENGTLALDPIDISLAGGDVDGNLQLDSGAEPAELRTEISAESIQLNDLVSPFFDLQENDLEVRGGMGVNLEAATAGNSMHEWASQLDGSFSWAIYDGVLPAVLMEALGLDLTEGVVSWFGDAPATGINCGVGRFDITSGVISTETLLLSTEDSNLIGDGTINLGEETIDYELESHAKDFSILASDSPIRIEGELNDISVSVVSGELLASLGASALLALVNPALAVVPFTELGTAETGHCRDLRQELQRIKEESQ